jgi:hypothetical protein
MTQYSGLHDIPYQEYRSIAELVRAHVAKYNDKLRAVVAFGELLTTGGTFDIDLLEVIEGWQDKRLAVFSGLKELPLRGRLRLFLLTSEFF